MTKGKQQPQGLQIVARSIDDLIPYARNARTHSDEQVAQLAASLREFGWTNPVLVDGERGIIAGHGRVMAARKLLAAGATIPNWPDPAQVPTIELAHLTPAQRRAYVLADNQLATRAGWDRDVLAVELDELRDDGFDLDLIGFERAELNDLIGTPNDAPLLEEDEVPVIRGEPITVSGDVWILGAHRLMCGSCTDAAAVASLMRGERADLCLTDPPYGLGKGKESGKNAYAEYEDTRENLIDLAAKWLPIARSVAKVVVFSPGVTNQWLYPEPNWVMCWFYGGGPLRSSWGFNCWQPFLCYGKEPGLAAGQGARPDAVDMNTPANAGDIDHPCPKPVKLWEWFLERLIFVPHATLFEPFSGSGTTLIAAEGKPISVRAMELTPYYVDVAVRRWQAFTGQHATLEATGVTFDEVAEQRKATEAA